jgi:nitroimidazol reductase NimA-like FMN-containing flavoprotein (pyridoxamine 5'-phosphate oxidase superfamily)
MNKVVSLVRDIELIESELEKNAAGVLSVTLEAEKITQMTTTYLYLDKNIYIFFNEENELYDVLPFNCPIIYTVVNSERNNNSKKGVQFSYRVFSVSISGIIKKIDDLKTAEDLRKNYMKKYFSPTAKFKEKELRKIIMIDSEEIQAFEEVGK